MTTKIYGAAKPSLEAALEHHGVKGQRWGVRKETKLQGKLANPSNSNRRNKNLSIKLARVHTEQRQRDLHTLNRQANKAKTAGEQRKYDALATKKANEIFNHPDTLTATRMTTGEKVVSGLLIGATIGVAGVQGAARAGGRAPTQGGYTPRAPYKTTAYVNR